MIKSIAFSAGILLMGLTSCTVMRNVERMVPEIPDMMLIGKKAPTVDPADPATLVPDLENDAAVFSIDVQGQSRRIVIQLYPNEAPMTVANFQHRVRSKYYERMAIHRAIPNYLVQMGDPQSKDPNSRAAWGTGGFETTLPPEIRLPHRLGAVGMARRGDASNPARASSSSQVYVTLGDLNQLNGKYTIFGQVIQGYDTLQTISTFPADENDNPYQRLQIRSAFLDRSRNYAPEDIESIHRKTSRRSVEEMPPPDDAGALKRVWRRIW